MSRFSSLALATFSGEGNKDDSPHAGPELNTETSRNPLILQSPCSLCICVIEKRFGQEAQLAGLRRSEEKTMKNAQLVLVFRFTLHGFVPEDALMFKNNP